MTDNLLDGSDGPVSDPNKDYLAELVGEGKKFKSPQDLAKGKYEADEYIKTLTMRNDELRDYAMKLKEDNTSRAKLEELIDRLNSKQQSDDSDITPPANDRDKPGFTPEQLETFFSNKISQHESQKREAENFKFVQEKLREHYGDNYQSVLKNQIEELGLTPDFVNKLAKEHPSVLFRTLRMDQPVRETFQAPPRNERRNDNFATKAQEHTMSWYKKTYGNDPKIYLDPKITVQMHKDAERLGEAFFD